MMRLIDEGFYEDRIYSSEREMWVIPLIPSEM